MSHASLDTKALAQAPAPPSYPQPTRRTLTLQLKFTSLVSIGIIPYGHHQYRTCNRPDGVVCRYKSLNCGHRSSLLRSTPTYCIKSRMESISNQIYDDQMTNKGRNCPVSGQWVVRWKLILFTMTSSREFSANPRRLSRNNFHYFCCDTFYL